MRNSLLPTLAVLVLVALVVLIPEPESGSTGAAEGLPAASAAGEDVARGLLDLRPLELYEPPAWARQKGGRDALVRSLDRLAWGPHAGQLASRDLLAEHPEELAPRILERLQALGESDPIVVSLLLNVVSAEAAAHPPLLEELHRRALSSSGLVAKAALRALRRLGGPESLAAALARRHDDDEAVRGLARSILGEAVRRGDPEARAYVLEDLRARPAAPYQDDLAALGDAPYDAESMEVLRTVYEQAPHTERLAALGALVRHGDERAIAEIEEQIASRDMATRQNALFIAASAGRPVARDQWEALVERGLRHEAAFTFSMLNRVIESGGRDAPLAYALIERVAQDPTHSAQVDALDLLFRYGDAWALERTRAELLRERGHYLAQTVQRILNAPDYVSSGFAELAEQRLEGGELGGPEQLVLMQLLAKLEPERAAGPVVQMLLDGVEVSPESMLPALVSLGRPGLAELEPHVGGDRGAGLYVLAASHLGDPSALPVLERIARDTTLDEALRRFALDGIVRLRGGDREAALRRVAEAWDDPAVRDRAMRLFWNYL